MEQEKNQVEKGLLIKKSASKALGVVQAVPRALMQQAAVPYEQLSPDVRDQLIDELHTYPLKNQRFARLIWSVFGLFGGHRFYLGQVGLGALMLLSVGGCLVWWIIDGFKLRQLVDVFNEEQRQRQQEKRPPIGLDYVPMVEPEVLERPPAWGEKIMMRKGTPKGKGRFFWEIVADGLAVIFFAFLCGAMAQETGYRTAALAVLAIVAMINFADYLLPWHAWPLVSGMIHWDYRLRLFYHFNAPGRRLLLYLRPLIGLFYAPFRPKARSEVVLYLEIGSIFLVFRALYGLAGGETWQLLSTFDIGGFLESWMKGIVLGFFSIYAFAAPIGAILMKHVLLRRANYVRWGLSLLILYFLISGYLPA